MPRQGIMLCSKFTDKRVNLWLRKVGYVYVQPKFNGQRAWWNGEHLISSEGNIIQGVPHIEIAMMSEPSYLKLDGELYCHGMSRQEISSRTMRTVNRHDDYRAIRYFVFDFKSYTLEQSERIKILSAMKTDHRKFINPVPTGKATSLEEIQLYLANALSTGFEGIVIRHPEGLYKESRTTMMMKLKPKYEQVVEVTQVHVGEGKYAGTLGAFTVLDKNGYSFNVGSLAIPDDLRDKMWEQKDIFIGKRIMISYNELSDMGIPPSSVFKTVVTEENNEI